MFLKTPVITDEVIIDVCDWFIISVPGGAVDIARPLSRRGFPVGARLESAEGGTKSAAISQAAVSEK